MTEKDKRAFGGRFLFCRVLACETVAGAEAPATDGAAEATPPETGNEGQGEVNQPSQPESDGYNPEWYKTDGRVGKMWKSADVRDDIVKSYFHLEKQYEPLSTKVKGYDTAFSELGLNGIDDVKNIVSEYQKFQDPENPLIQRAGLFSKFYDKIDCSTIDHRKSLKQDRYLLNSLLIICMLLIISFIRFQPFQSLP
jgi:hypothetical protein